MSVNIAVKQTYDQLKRKARKADFIMKTNTNVYVNLNPCGQYIKIGHVWEILNGKDANHAHTVNGH